MGMPTFRNTLDIITNPWNEDFSKSNVSPGTLPPSDEWTADSHPNVSDIIFWEQLYYEPGNVGIYVAYNPRVEFYLITHNLFFDSEFKFETFDGENAAQRCYDRAAELGIYLSYS